MSHVNLVKGFFDAVRHVVLNSAPETRINIALVLNRSLQVSFLLLCNHHGISSSSSDLAGLTVPDDDRVSARVGINDPLLALFCHVISMDVRSVSDDIGHDTVDLVVGLPVDPLTLQIIFLHSSPL